MIKSLISLYYHHLNWPQMCTRAPNSSPHPQHRERAQNHPRGSCRFDKRIWRVFHRLRGHKGSSTQLMGADKQVSVRICGSMNLLTRSWSSWVSAMTDPYCNRFWLYMSNRLPFKFEELVGYFLFSWTKRYWQTRMLKSMIGFLFCSVMWNIFLSLWSSIDTVIYNSSLGATSTQGMATSAYEV